MFGTAPVVTKTLNVSELNIPNSARIVKKDNSKSVNNYKIEKSDLFDQAEADFCKLYS